MYKYFIVYIMQIEDRRMQEKRNLQYWVININIFDPFEVKNDSKNPEANFFKSLLKNKNKNKK